MSEWIVTAFERSEITDAALVTAEDSDTAALMGAEVLQSEREAKGSEETVPHVFVAPFDVGTRLAYRTGMSVSRAPLQCCAGPAPSYVDCDGHYATCPERPEGTGQPRPPEGVPVLPHEREDE